MMVKLSLLWTKLVGDGKLSQNHRIVNAILIISMAFLVPSTIINVVVSLQEPLIINCTLICILYILYQVSRHRKQYKCCFIIYAICSYAALVATFFYNAGTIGPALFLFFLTFYLLIAISPREQHLVWTVTHIIVGFTLMWIEIYYPHMVHGYYANKWSRFYDMAFTYIISLFFLYLITLHLRKRYEKEKRRVRRQTKIVLQKTRMIMTQNKRLKEIAAIQSHEVRGQVATILGLAELIDSKNLSNPVNHDVMIGIKESAGQLDQIIRNINELTKESGI